MKKIISVYTNDIFLFQKIKLDCPADTEAILAQSDSDLCLFDIDTAPLPIPDGALTMSRNEDADIKIPFLLGTVSTLLLSKAGSPLLSLDKTSKCARLRGEKIKFTEVEFSLLSFLYKKGGEFATRDEILRAVWGEGADAGVINVYIHYLREKLEGHGEKIIISSRKCGYKIDEKYLKESEIC